MNIGLSVINEPCPIHGIIGELMERDERHSISIRWSRELAGKPLSEICAHQHISIGDDPTIESLYDATHVPDAKKLFVLAAHYQYLYLHDATQLNASERALKNTVFMETLAELNCAIIEEQEVLCLVIGSIAGWKYIQSNEKNQNCPIHLFFRYNKAKQHILFATPQHVAKLNESLVAKRKESSPIIELTECVFLKNLLLRERKHTFVIDETTLMLKSYRSRSERESDNVVVDINKHAEGFIIDSMANEYLASVKNGHHFVKAVLGDGGNHLYKATVMQGGGRKTITIVMYTAIGDEPSDTERTESNVSKLSSEVQNSLETNHPLIICLQPTACEFYMSEKVVNTLIAQASPYFTILNSREVNYVGELLGVTDIHTANDQFLEDNTNPLYMGVLSNKRNVETFVKCVENSNCTIAITKMPIAQLPSSIRHYAKVITP
ncbi:hypothetical protein [Vibrio sp. Hal054]|uniref:hypothetical protein n=1 Tax=Vibrio sp. Hal054 TaxID=3035158 RepID=UPI00301D2221